MANAIADRLDSLMNGWEWISKRPIHARDATFTKHFNIAVGIRNDIIANWNDAVRAMIDEVSIELENRPPWGWYCKRCDHYIILDDGHNDGCRIGRMQEIVLRMVRNYTSPT